MFQNILTEKSNATLTGTIVSAERAEQIGLVSKVVTPENLIEEVMAYAQLIVVKGPIALRHFMNDFKGEKQ